MRFREIWRQAAYIVVGFVVWHYLLRDDVVVSLIVPVAFVGIWTVLNTIKRRRGRAVAGLEPRNATQAGCLRQVGPPGRQPPAGRQ